MHALKLLKLAHFGLNYSINNRVSFSRTTVLNFCMAIKAFLLRNRCLERVHRSFYNVSQPVNVTVPTLAAAALADKRPAQRKVTVVDGEV